MPKLTLEHKAKHLNFACNFLSNPAKWKTIIYSDKKCFNLDGSDGLHYYWHDLWKMLKQFITRQQGSGSVMVWVAFSFNGKTDLCYCPSKVNSLVYLQIVEQNLLPFASASLPDGFLFMQDNAAVHTSKV